MVKLVKAVKCAIEYDQFTSHTATLQLSGVGYVFVVEQVQRADANPCWRKAR